MDLQLIPLDFSKLGTPVDPLPEPSAKNLTVVARPARWQLHSLPFNPDLYFEHLMTAQLGRTVLYTPVISSTQTVFTGNMTFCNALTPRLGVVCVAAQQTQGKGERTCYMCVAHRHRVKVSRHAVCGVCSTQTQGDGEQTCVALASP